MRAPPKSIVSWVELDLIAVVVSPCAIWGDPLTSRTEYDTLVPG